LATSAKLYLDLLKRCLTRTGFDERIPTAAPRRPDGSIDGDVLSALVERGEVELVQRRPADALVREVGLDWPPPPDAETMIGLRRLTNLEECIVDVLEHDVPGDLVECGVWRGGASIFMRGVLEAYGDTDRCVWLADSFQGVPPPDPAQYPADEGVDLSIFPALAIGSDQVQRNFLRYDLLDPRVRLLPGWFKDTLSTAPIERIALLRADGDLYESTVQILENLYPKVSVGGWVVIDDYGAIEACRQATDEYRAAHDVTEPLQTVDWTAVCWKRRQ
jgi:O-methyltransferase